MSEFEFVLILVSIVLGLGLTDLLTVAARVMRQEFSGGVVHGLWAVHVGGLLLQQFWAKWNATIVSDWSVLRLTFLIAPSFLAYLAAALLSPSTVEGGSLDPYFVKRRRPFFVVLSLLMASYSTERWLLLDMPLSSDDAMSVPPIVLYLIAASSSSRRIQVVTALLATSLLVVFTLGWTPSLA